MDLGGAELDPTGSRVPVTGGTPVTVEQVQVSAEPVTVHGVRLRARGELHRLQGAWATDGAGLLWLVPHDDAPGPGTDGRVVLSARVGDLEQALLRLGGPLLAQRGFTLTAVRLHVEAEGRASARVHVQAQVRRGILSATVDGRGTAAVDEAMVLTLGDLTVTSANPLVSMGLAMVSRQLQAWEGRQIDLGSHLVGGLGVHEVSLRTEGDEVVLGARVGQ